MQETLDVLCLRPQCRVNLQLLRRALVFGFSSGDTDRAFEKVLETAEAPASAFHPENFEADLFLREFVEHCAAARGKAHPALQATLYLRRVISHPPLYAEETQARQAAVQWLTENNNQLHAVRLYTALREFRDLLSAADFSTRVDPNQRRLDVLRAFQNLVERMSDGFEHAGALLGRVHAFARELTSQTAFVQLRDFLRFERSATRLDVRVHVGLDGSVRDFEIVHCESEPHGPFQRSFFLRLLRKIGLLFRGVQLSEQELLSRVLFVHFEALRESMLSLFQLIGDLEFYLAAASFADICTQQAAAWCFATFGSEANGPTALVNLTNPFLLAEGGLQKPKSASSVKPCSVSPRSDAIVIVTGPNSGGKTRLMQSVAYAQLLGQLGFPVPAARAELMFAGGLFVSMLDEVRPDQREGRLGMELLRIRRLFEQVRPRELVVLDELCSGTNPSEGEEIFALVLELLSALGPQVWISTHFLRFASQLQSAGTPNLHFLRAQLDAQERPLFDFESGVAQTSLAKQTAARLGVTRDELARLVQTARELGPRSTNTAGKHAHVADT